MIKRRILGLLAALAIAVPVFAQTNSTVLQSTVTVGGTPVGQYMPVQQTAGAATVVPATTSSNVVGVTMGAGSVSGTVPIVLQGITLVTFDNNPVVGDYAVVGSGGAAHDSGVTLLTSVLQSQWTIGVVKSFVSSTSAYVFVLPQMGQHITSNNVVDPTTSASVQSQIAALQSSTPSTGTTITPIISRSISATSAGSKQCYVGNPNCNGGVGTNAPSGTPIAAFGLATPDLGYQATVPNSTAHYAVATQFNSPQYTDYLVPSTIGTADNALYWERHFRFKGAENFNFNKNLEADSYLFIKPDGYNYAAGQQCNTVTGVWQYANQTSSWQNTTAPCVLNNTDTYEVTLDYHRDAATSTACSGAPCIHWDKLIFTDVTTSTSNTYNWTYTMPAVTLNSTWASAAGGQVQLDCSPTGATSGSPVTCGVYTQNDTVSFYASAFSSGTTSTTTSSTKGNLISCNFDINSFCGATLTTPNSPSLDNTNVNTAPNALHATTALTYATYTASAPAKEHWMRMYVKVNTVGSAGVEVADFYSGVVGSLTQLGNIYINSVNNFVTLFDTATNTSTACGPTAIAAGSYHRIELHWISSATAGVGQVYLDGTLTNCNLSGANTGTTNMTVYRIGQVGNPVTPWDVDIDDFDVSSIGLLGAVTQSTTGAVSQPTGTALLIANNLGDLSDPNAARTNLQLGSMAQQNNTNVNIDGGTIDGTAIGSATPSTANVTGLETNVVSVTANTTLTSSNQAVECNATSGAVTITLPATPLGWFSIIKTDSSANACTVNGNGHNINGASTQSLATQYASMQIKGDSALWYMF